MTLRTDILDRQKVAMKNKDTDTLSVLRMLWADIRNAEIDAKKELDDRDVIAVVKKQVKQFKDSLSDMQRGGRDDLAEKLLMEIRILEEYLPAELSDEEIRLIVKKELEEAKIVDKSDLGRAMSLVMGVVAGRADGARVRAVVAECLR